MRPLLTVRDLRVSYRLAADAIPALRGVSVDVFPRQAVGLLGESGSGKSTLASTLVAASANGTSCSGIINFAGISLLTASARDLRKIRGARISYIAQDPAQALSPVLKVGQQVGDVLRAHKDVSRGAAQAAVQDALAEVGLDAAMYHAYPHQLSGGQRQRVAIAQALICRPELLIADEPTTALDPSTQAETLKLIKRLRTQHDMALLLISHDPAVIAEMVEYVYVMQQGDIVEHGSVSDVMSMPASEYTCSLLNASPRLAYVHGA